MSVRAALLCLAPTLVAAAALAQPVLQSVGTVTTPPPIAWAPWGDLTVAVTDLDARLVTWPNEELGRARTLFDLPAPPSLVESWGDSILIQVPGEGGRLLARGVNDPAVWIDEPANWRLPNTAFDGAAYRVFVDPQVFLIVYSAPGPGGILGLLDFAETIGQADVWAWDGDRVLLGNDDGVHVVSISNPFVPVVTTLITPTVQGWRPHAVAVRDRTAFVHWGDRIATYDLSNPGTPPQLDEFLVSSPFFVVGERWLLSWGGWFGEPENSLVIFDAADPTAVGLRGALEAPADLTGAQVAVRGDRIEITHALGLALYDIPAGMAPPIDQGLAWPVMEGWPLATAGATAWLQGNDRRYVIDLTGREVVNVQARGRSSSTGSLLVRDDILYHSRGSALGVSIESLADPRDPQPLTVLDPAPGLEGIDVVGDLLAAADGAGLVLYDVTDPATPVRRGELPLEGATRRVVIVDQVAVVTAAREFDVDLAHVVAIGDPDVPQLIQSFDLEDPGGPDLTLASQTVRRGDRVHVLLTGSDAIFEPVFGTATIDLVIPATPQLSFAEGADFWCFDPREGFSDFVPTRDFPVAIGDYHVSFRADTLSVYAYQGGPDQLALQSSWVAPHAIETIAVSGNRLLVFGDHRLDLLTLSDLAIVGVPDRSANTTVHAVPNPFNPQTEIVFAMPRAGTARVEIYDLRGSQVGRLEADLPAGPARLTWRGRDRGGRAVPSGTYLLRVRTPAGILSGPAPSFLHQFCPSFSLHDFLLLNPSFHRSGSGRYAVIKTAGEIAPSGIPQTT